MSFYIDPGGQNSHPGGSRTDFRAEKYQNNEIEMVSIHSPFFAPDPKPTITTGIKAMTASALGLLK